MIRRVVAARPLAISMVAFMLVLAVGTGVLRTSSDATSSRHHWGIDPELLAHGHMFPGLLTGLLLPDGPLQAVFGLSAVLLTVGAAERRLGRVRTVWVFIATGIVGTAVGMLMELAGLATHQIAAGPPMTLVVLDPTIPCSGLAFATSAFVGSLWKRRIRVLGSAALVVAMVYTGGPADLYRIGAAVAGTGLGVLLTRRRPARPSGRGSHHEARSTVAVLVGITAVGPVVAALSPHGWGLLRPVGQLVRSSTPAGRGAERWCHVVHTAAQCGREFTALTPGVGAQLVSVLPLLVLALAAVGIWHGRRVAAIVAVAIELLFAVLGAVYFDLLPLIGSATEHARSQSVTPAQAVLAVLVPLLVAVVVLLERRHFTVETAPRAVKLAVIVASSGVLLSAAGFLAAAWMARAQFSPRPRLVDLLWDLPERYVPIGFLRLRRADFVPTGPAAHDLWTWTGPLAWAVVTVALLICLGAVRDRNIGRDAPRVRALLRRASAGPIAAMAVWPGNRYWFSDDGRHVVAYRPVDTVAITVGEPIGPEDGAVAAARDFSTDCDNRGLTPVFYTVRPEFADALTASTSWRTVPVGEDTVIELDAFSMTGKRWADVRSSINRAARTGVRAEWTTWERATLAQRLQIEAISEDWASEKRLPEMTFTLGGLTEIRDSDTRLVLAIDGDGRVEAVTSWLPSWRDGKLTGLTLDFMRRRTGGMNGVMEFLIATVAIDSKREGLETISLSASPLAGTSVTADSATDRVLGRLALLLEPAYGFRSLATFKDKFQPDLRPLLMAFPDRVALPSIAVALLHAYLPEASPRHLFVLLSSHRATRARRVRTRRVRATASR